MVRYMGMLAGKIKKLCQALAMRGEIYLIDRRQQYSEKLGKPVTVLILNKSIPVEEYNRLNPEKQKNPEKQHRLKVAIMDSFKEIDILLRLVDIYKAGDSSG